MTDMTLEEIANEWKLRDKKEREARGISVETNWPSVRIILKNAGVDYVHITVTRDLMEGVRYLRKAVEGEEGKKSAVMMARPEGGHYYLHTVPARFRNRKFTWKETYYRPSEKDFATAERIADVTSALETIAAHKVWEEIEQEERAFHPLTSVMTEGSVYLEVETGLITAFLGEVQRRSFMVNASVGGKFSPRIVK